MKASIIFCLLLFAGTCFAQNKVGINTSSPTELLDVNGNANFRNLVKLNGNAGAAGQVLMSQGASTPPVWANNGGGSFWTTLANATRTTNSAVGRGSNWVLGSDASQEDSVDFAVATVTGTDMSVVNIGAQGNYVVINTSGLYHFEGTTRLFVTADDAVGMAPRAVIKFKANRPSGLDPDIYLVEERLSLTGSPSTGSATNQFNLLTNFGITIYLEAGTTCTFLNGFNLLRFTVPLLAMGASAGGYIAGQLIAK